uniref:Uncharacterized protein n=1 Tax=Xiphophorus maculatus TaxID=8083 RepID=A0A3B5PWB9_XIPMA
MAAESTRRFTKNLLKPGSAAEIRQTACNAVRHSAVTVSGPPWIVKYIFIWCGSSSIELKRIKQGLSRYISE